MTYWNTAVERSKMESALSAAPSEQVVGVNRRLTALSAADGSRVSAIRFEYWLDMGDGDGWKYTEHVIGRPHERFVDEMTFDESGTLYREILKGTRKIRRGGDW